MAPRYVIAHDIGTRQAKTVLVSLDGRLLAAAAHPYVTSSPHHGWAEQEPTDWWAAACAGTREVLAAGGAAPNAVAGLAFGGQMLGVVPTDAVGRPLRPAIIWSDARASAEAEALMRRLLGPATFAAVVGATASGKDVVPKLLWLRRHEPEVYRHAAVFLDVVGYLVHRCTGVAGLDWTGASATGLFDFRRRRWQPLLARIAGVPSAKLPAPRQPATVAGPLQAEPAADLGLPAGVPVVVGAGDVPCAAIGTGTDAVGSAHIYLGTSAWVAVTVPRPHRGHSGIHTLATADPDRYLLVGATEAGGACRDWLAEALFGDTGPSTPTDVHATIDAAVEAAPPGADGLLFAPWLFGERTPVPDNQLRAAFLGLAPAHRREHLARAVCEGVALNLRWVLDIMHQRFGECPATLRLAGGGAASDTWSRILADVTGRRIERVSAARDAGALGAAWLAARAIGADASAPWPSLGAVERAFTPRPEVRGVYDRCLAQLQVAAQTLGRFHREANL